MLAGNSLKMSVGVGFEISSTLVGETGSKRGSKHWLDSNLMRNLRAK